MAPEQGFTLWFTGLSGAGKTTITELVVEELEARGSAIEVLDGDVVRQNLSKGLGFSKEDRDTNIRRVAFVADLLSRNGVPVITAATRTCSFPVQRCARCWRRARHRHVSSRGKRLRRS